MTIEQVFSVLTALAALSSPFVAIYVTRRQVTASVISTNRQAWIDGLRSDVADLLDAQATINTNSHLVRQGHAGPAETEVLRTALSVRERAEARIVLRLNPNEHDHAELAHAVQGLGVEDPEETVLIQRNIIAMTQPILKREWQRVKLGG